MVFRKLLQGSVRMARSARARRSRCVAAAVVAMALACSAAAEDQQQYQIQWQYHGHSGYFAAFQDTAGNAQQKFLLAQNSNSGVNLSLLAPAGKPHPFSFPERIQAAHGSQRLYVLSLAAFDAANALDMASSFGRRELNPLLSSADQRFDWSSAGKKLAIVGGINLVQILAVRHHPRAKKLAAVANLVMTGVLVGVAIHNFRLPVSQ